MTAVKRKAGDPGVDARKEAVADAPRAAAMADHAARFAADRHASKVDIVWGVVPGDDELAGLGDDEQSYVRDGSSLIRRLYLVCAERDIAPRGVDDIDYCIWLFCKGDPEEAWRAYRYLTWPRERFSEEWLEAIFDDFERVRRSGREAARTEEVSRRLQRFHERVKMAFHQTPLQDVASAAVTEDAAALGRLPKAPAPPKDRPKEDAGLLERSGRYEEERRGFQERNLTEADHRALFWRERLLVALHREMMAQPEQTIFRAALGLAIEGHFVQVRDLLNTPFGDEHRKRIDREYIDISSIVVDTPADHEQGVQKFLLLDRADIVKAFNEAKPIGGKDEGLLSDALTQYFEDSKLPRQLWKETAAEFERIIRKQIAKGEVRPLWDERERYPELAHLSAPRFLKQVWADLIGPDGAIDRELIGRLDKKLLSNVSTYIAKREDRGQTLGDAAGLRLVSQSRAGRPKRLGLD